MHRIRSEPLGGAGSIFVCEFYMWKVNIPIVLAYIHRRHGQNLSHRVVGTFYTPGALALAVVIVAHAQVLENGDRKVGVGLEAGVRQDARGEAPQRCVLGDHILCSSSRGISRGNLSVLAAYMSTLRLERSRNRRM